MLIRQDFFILSYYNHIFRILTKNIPTTAATSTSCGCTPQCPYVSEFWDKCPYVSELWAKCPYYRRVPFMGTSFYSRGACPTEYVTIRHALRLLQRIGHHHEEIASAHLWHPMRCSKRSAYTFSTSDRGASPSATKRCVHKGR